MYVCALRLRCFCPICLALFEQLVTIGCADEMHGDLFFLAIHPTKPSLMCLILAWEELTNTSTLSRCQEFSRENPGRSAKPKIINNLINPPQKLTWSRLSEQRWQLFHYFRWKAHAPWQHFERLIIATLTRGAKVTCIAHLPKGAFRH